MRIADVLQENCIRVQASCASRLEALRQMSGMLSDAGLIYSKSQFLVSVLAREELEPTALGMGIAVPHGRSPAVRRPCMALMTLVPGIDYGAPDGVPVQIIFMLATPPEAADVHLEMLALVAEAAGGPKEIDRILSCRSAGELYSLLTAS
jgi:fructose-specific phosphotransferase system IIA component